MTKEEFKAECQIQLDDIDADIQRLKARAAKLLAERAK